jgi:NADH-quinone oxidoreductase subunit N
LLALAGLPPTVGFTGKVFILASLVFAGYSWLAGLLIIGTVISAYVYLKIVFTMYARTAGAPLRPVVKPLSPLPWIALGACAVAVLVLGLYPLSPSAANIVPFVK